MPSPSDSVGTAGEISHGHLIEPSEPSLDMSDFVDLGHRHTESLFHSFMPMSRSDFMAIDLSVATPEERIQYFRMKTRMVRDRQEPTEARDYFDRIQAAYEESFEKVTPDLLADPTKMNLVICVDPYEDDQLNQLNFKSEEQAKIPGGLGWFDVTGTMNHWIVSRIFNPELAAGLHRNCGGFAILGCLNGERQAAARERTLANAHRITAETAAIVRQQYLLRKGRNFDPEGAEALATFSGPKLTFSEGQAGTAEEFVTPKSIQTAALEIQFTPREIIDNVEQWINHRLANKVSE